MKKIFYLFSSEDGMGRDPGILGSKGIVTIDTPVNATYLLDLQAALKEGVRVGHIADTDVGFYKVTQVDDEIWDRMTAIYTEVQALQFDVEKP